MLPRVVLDPIIKSIQDNIIRLQNAKKVLIIDPARERGEQPWSFKSLSY